MLRSLFAGKKIMKNGEKIVNILIEHEGRQRIAFLPYKRQMWDSMKSVYEAAVRAGLDAKVFPIPYYERDEQGRLASKHLEMGYGIDTRRPEEFFREDFGLIVIHNPYDDKNKVTSVDPDFYSERLKEYGKIVYIPYYAGGSGESFRKKPGARNAEYIFTATEEDREGFKNLYPEKKVFATGSPKTDGAEEIGEGNHTLVATSLGAFIRDPMGRLRRYKEVLQKEENVIFRPHPLLGATVRSMAPKSILAYEDLMKWAKENCEIDEYGVVAETMAKCNRLVTDRSSIIEIWKLTGRPYEIM